MTSEVLYTVVVGLVAIWALRTALKLKQAADRLKVTTRDLSLFRDQHAEQRRRDLALLQAPPKGPKGFAAQNDRRAHVHELKRKIH